VITVFLDFPVTINHEGIIYGLENFVVVMPIRLGMIIDTANDIIDESEDIGVEGLGFDFFSGFDPYVTLLPVEDATIVALHDESSGVDGEEFEFLFAIQ